MDHYQAARAAMQAKRADGAPSLDTLRGRADAAEATAKAAISDQWKNDATAQPASRAVTNVDATRTAEDARKEMMDAILGASRTDAGSGAGGHLIIDDSAAKVF